MEASGNNNKPKQRQTAIILHCAGPQVLEVYDHFEFEGENDKNDPVKAGPFLTYKLGGQMPPQSPLVPPPPRNHILPPQEKSLFPKIIQTIQRGLTNR